MTNWVEVPTDFAPHSIAEYIEAICLLDDVEHLSQSELRSRFPSGQQPSSQEISFSLAEVESRFEMLGMAYPYRYIDSGIVRMTSGNTAIYDFMTILSLDSAPFRWKREFGRSDLLFDAVVREASKAYLGAGAKALRFGWPPRDGRPTNFVEAVSWAGRQLGVPDGVLDRPTEEKDGGVDIIAWKPFNDGRTAFPVYLIQDTVSTDYVTKPRDIEPNSWMQWLRLGTLPDVGLAIPFAVPRGDDRWVKMNDTADLILDRFRITEIFSKIRPESLPELGNISEFNAREIESIRSGEFTSVGVQRSRRQRRSEYRDLSAR